MDLFAREPGDLPFQRGLVGIVVGNMMVMMIMVMGMVMVTLLLLMMMLG